ncbi:MAG: hypothetical protein LQ351_004641 [Letrouitia transgressa]|nr:MAG: hypothetical protein LQ351_004641 [Letrouitia transgressa]
MANISILDVAMRDKLYQDHKRELDQKHKWALGEAVRTPGQACRRPAKAASTTAPRRLEDLQRCKPGRALTVARKREVLDNDFSDSTEEEVKDASAAPEPDAGVMYSYDAATGPRQSGQIFTMAVATAIQNYEKKATERLVKEEYEVVGMDEDELPSGYTADEDGEFELV